MAKALLSQDATVIIGARKGPKLNKAYEQLSSAGYDVHAVPLDVRDETSVMDAATWFEAHFDHLDMLVNNAGIGDNAPGMEKLAPGHRFYDIPAATVRAVVETNMLGHFLVASRFVPLMVERGQGSLVYVSTSTSTMARKGQFPYGPSKAGAEAMTVIMAEELREAGIAVNIICPGGFTDTGMAGVGVKAFFQRHNMPILPPTIMNEVILFLASPEAKSITGEKIIAKDFETWLNNRGLAFSGKHLSSSNSSSEPLIR